MTANSHAARTDGLGTIAPTNPSTASAVTPMSLRRAPPNIARFSTTFAPQNIRTASIATRKNQATAAPVKP
ncbi:hypothetical protein D3C75_1323350 [compost metagenome]